MHFYLGAHQPAWLAQVDVPLFVSDRRLRTYTSVDGYPKARVGWALDSGGFTQLSTHGGWDADPADRNDPLSYVQRVKAYDLQIGLLEWAAPQDWMCEPWIIERTGLTVEEHQERTVANFVELERLWRQWDSRFSFASCRGARSPFVPVLQGWTVADYWRCVDLYAQAGVRLADYPLVGLGSVCRRQATDEIGALVRSLGSVLKLHGFGVKTDGLARYGYWLTSADSMAWSLDGRHTPGCAPSHKHEGNCQLHAMAWRRRVLERMQTGPAPHQLGLFAGAAR